MKIGVILRTRDESANIEAFIRSYHNWVDTILIADGGSTDDTLALASACPKVQIAEFTDRVSSKTKPDVWINPEGKHINYLIAWAGLIGLDFVFFDDCDCRPNALLRRDAASIIANLAPEVQIIRAVRLYWWGQDRFFPHLAQPVAEDVWEPSLWGWRLSCGLHCEEKTDWAFTFMPKLGDLVARDLYPPYCLNHHGWPSQAVVERKLQRHRAFHAMHDPCDFGGGLEPLPDWSAE